MGDTLAAEVGGMLVEAETRTDTDRAFVDLLASARQGDGEAWGALSERHFRSVERFAAERGAEDAGGVANYALGRFAASIESFRGETERSLAAYLRRIATNRIIDEHRRQRLQQTPLDEVGDPVDHQASSFDDQIAAGDWAAQMLDHLSNEQQEVLRLRILEQRSVPETAAILGKHPQAVHALQYRGLKKLRLLILAAAAVVIALAVRGLLFADGGALSSDPVSTIPGPTVSVPGERTDEGTTDLAPFGDLGSPQPSVPSASPSVGALSTDDGATNAADDGAEQTDVGGQQSAPAVGAGNGAGIDPVVDAAVGAVTDPAVGAVIDPVIGVAPSTTIAPETPSATTTMAVQSDLIGTSTTVGGGDDLTVTSTTLTTLTTSTTAIPSTTSTTVTTPAVSLPPVLRLDESAPTSAVGSETVQAGSLTTWIQIERLDRLADHLIFSTDDSRIALFVDTTQQEFGQVSRIGARAGGNQNSSLRPTTWDWPEASVHIDTGAPVNELPTARQVVEGAWHHVAMTWSGYPEGTVEVFFDGRLVQRTTYDSRYDNGQPLPTSYAVGFRPRTWAGTGGLFASTTDGGSMRLVDGVITATTPRLYTRPLSASQVGVDAAASRP